MFNLFKMDLLKEKMLRHYRAKNSKEKEKKRKKEKDD